MEGRKCITAVVVYCLYSALDRLLPFCVMLHTALYQSMPNVSTARAFDLSTTGLHMVCFLGHYRHVYTSSIYCLQLYIHSPSATYMTAVVKYSRLHYYTYIAQKEVYLYNYNRL